MALDGVSALDFIFFSDCCVWLGGKEKGRLRGIELVVLGPVGRLVGGVRGLYGCEADAVVSLDLGSVVSLFCGWCVRVKGEGYGYSHC